MTTYLLEKYAASPMQIVLFEASGRLGGKVHTPLFSHQRVRYEAGAAEFYDYSRFDDDPLKDLIAELGLPVRPMGGSAVISAGDVIGNMDDLSRYLGRGAHQQLMGFDSVAKNMITPREFYFSDEPDGGGFGSDVAPFTTILETIGDDAARGYLEHLIHSDLATEPARTNVRYGLHNYLMNDPAYMGLYSIDGGNERLIWELAARLSAEVRLEHRITAISGGPHDSLRVHWQGDTQEHSELFDFVVVALPHNQLLSIDYRSPALQAAIREHHQHYDYPAHYLRVTLLFERPFWRQVLNDSFWMLDAFGGCCLYDESSRDAESEFGILGWLLAGDAALEKSSLNDPQLVEEALASLPPELACGRTLLLEARVHRWVAAVNGMPGGNAVVSHDARHQIAPHKHPNFFLVGDYMFDSTLNGVLDSAEYVARWLAALACGDQATYG